MSEVKVNKISPRTNCGTVTLGDSGDTFTIPAGVTITNNGTQNGFGRSGSVDWQTTPKTNTFTAASGEGYFINSGSAITANLPAGSAGAIVAFSDYARNFATYNLTITPNGSEKIGGTAASAKLNVDGQAATFVYVDSTKGWINVQNAEDTEKGAAFITATGGTESNSGNDRIHTFTGPGTFTVSDVSPVAANNEVSYLIVGGGAAGGFGGSFGGGGGAGGFRETKTPVTPYTASPLDGYSTPGNRITVSAQAYPIVVGGGGTGLGPGSTEAQGAPGNNSSFGGIVSAGGGGGGEYSSSPGLNGGSGGGSGNATSGGGKGSGNTPPTTPPQGQPGGDQNPGYGSQVAGGGGATQAGSDAAPGNTSNGGAGATTSINGTPTTYGGGGGGGANAPLTNSGGAGGGGDGGHDAPNSSGTAGTDNTGGGGGGNGPTATSSGGGGSGIVIIRYKVA